MDDTRPLMADSSDSKDSSTTEEDEKDKIVDTFALDGEDNDNSYKAVRTSPSADANETSFIHAVDSLNNISALTESSKTEPSPTSRSKKKSKKSKSDSEEVAVSSQNITEMEAIETIEGEEGDIEDAEEGNQRGHRRSESRKSVRWTDDFEGGELAQVTSAPSYNRKELSYQPRTRIRFGNFSPLQKRIMIGIAVTFIILLIVVLIIIFVVLKPQASTPQAAPIGLHPQEPPPPSGLSLKRPDIL